MELSIEKLDVIDAPVGDVSDMVEGFIVGLLFAAIFAFT